MVLPYGGGGGAVLREAPACQAFCGPEKVVRSQAAAKRARDLDLGPAVAGQGRRVTWERCFAFALLLAVFT